MLIKSFNKEDITINIENETKLIDIYDIIKKKYDDIINKNSINLICNNKIINNDNLYENKENTVYLYIDKNKNKNKLNANDIFGEILKIIDNGEIEITINNSNNLNILIEMGYSEELSLNALEENNNNLYESIEYLLN
jgi:hypothetical protein